MKFLLESVYFETSAIQIFNSPTKEHEALSTPEYPKFFINIFNLPSKEHETLTTPEYPMLCY
jgi:hypothetical protein